MTVVQVYDQGQAFAPSVLDIEESALLKTFMQSITQIACISLATGYPTLPSVMHSLVNSYKNVLAVSIETDYTFEASEQIKYRLANPDEFAGAAAASTEAAPAAAEEKKEEAKEEEKEESDDDMGFGLFD